MTEASSDAAGTADALERAKFELEVRRQRFEERQFDDTSAAARRAERDTSRRDAARLLLAVAVAVVATVLAFRVVNDTTGSNDGGGGPDLLPRQAGEPREFLYLDVVRADAYLSQIDGGLVGAEQISRSVTRNTSAGIDSAAAGVQAQAATTVADSIARTLTPTNFSRFYRLSGLLEDRDQLQEIRALGGQVGERLDGGRFAAVKRTLLTTKEGQFVRLSAFIEVPDFVRLYLNLRLTPATTTVRRRAKQLLADVGGDPLLPLQATIRGPSGTTPLRVIVPVRYSALATQPSLLTGRLRAVGKIAYRVPRRPVFTDRLLAARFSGLSSLPRTVTSAYGLPSGRAMSAEVGSFARVDAPAVLLLPVAIFK